MATKKRRTTARKTTKKRVTRRSTKRTLKGFDWEIVPFVVAIIVAIVVVMQSVQSAKELRSGYSPSSVHAPLYHMAGGCTVDNTTMREIRTAERAVERALENGNSFLVQKSMREMQRLKVEACL